MQRLQNPDYSTIQNIIFDLGGVILNIDYGLTIVAFKELGIADFQLQFTQHEQSQLFDNLDKGKVTAEEFRNIVRALLPQKVDEWQIDRAWNAMLLDLPEERLKRIGEFKNSYRIFLLSNTNVIHIDCVHRYLQRKFNVPNFNEYFERVYYSFEIGMRKPDKEIFERVLLENNLKPAETLFIDDTLQHIEGAAKLGIKTHWLDVRRESILSL